MIKLKHLLREEDREKDILSKLEQNRVEYNKLLAQMYGPGGTEDRMAASNIKHVFAGSGEMNRPTTSPEFEKAKADNYEVMKKMADIGRENNAFYEELKDMGKEDFVKKWREEGMRNTEKYIKDLVNKSVQKLRDDSEAKEQSMKDKQKKYVDALKKELEKRNQKYTMDFRSWLQAGQKGPAPQPPSVEDVVKEFGTWDQWTEITKYFGE